MGLKDGDFARINYTGKIKGSGEVFDTTLEEVAKAEGVYDEKIQFKPTPAVIGAGHVIPGLDKALVGMEVGAEKTLDISPEEGYGLRDPKLVKVVPVKDFKRQGLIPVPGMRFEAEGKVGRVQSVGGGRVRVDFNYELAGKTLEYKGKVEEKVNGAKEKVKLLMERHFPYADPNAHEITLTGGKAVIVLSEEARNNKEALLGKHFFTREVFRFLDKISEVEFIESFKREAKKEKKGKGKEKGKGKGKGKKKAAPKK